MPKIIGLLPPDFPPGKNLLINFCKLEIKSSILGGSLLDPDPDPLPLPPLPLPGGAPHGDWFFNILSLKDMTLYIVTFGPKTS